MTTPKPRRARMKTVKARCRLVGRWYLELAYWRGIGPIMARWSRITEITS